jgi:hypothetical protein
MKRWILVVVIALALTVVVVIVGLTQIKLDALEEPGYLETFLATQVKYLVVHRSSREGIPPAPNESAGEHRGRGETLRHRMRNVSRPRRPYTH